MVEENKVNKVARIVKALFDLDGVKISLKDIAEIIQNDSLADVYNLKNKVTKEIDERKSKTKQSDRRESIKQFVVRHWDLIKDNEHVKTLFFNGYCAGRYKKDKREAMLQELISAAEDKEMLQELVDTTVAVAPAKDDIDPSDVELRPEDTDYDKLEF